MKTKNYHIVALWRHMALDILINTDLGNGWLSDDTKALPEPNRLINEVLWHPLQNNANSRYQPLICI